jgi:hypothetical protein
MRVEAGVGIAQAPREETAEIWRCGWNSVKCYGDLTGGTGAMSGDETGRLVGDLAELVKSAADGSGSVPHLVRQSA